MMGWSAEAARTSPIFEPLRVHGGTLFDAVLDKARPDLGDFQRLIDARDPPVRVAGGARLRVVPQGRRPAAFEDKYEARIHLKGELQVRPDSAHDAFNLLVWLAFPRAKAALNARHFAALREQSATGAANRGPAQDALTLLDEGGVVVASSDPGLLGLLRDWRWKDLFWRNRARLATHMQFLLFGHAVYEKALQPFLGRAEAWSRGPVLRGCDGEGVHESTVLPGALQSTPGPHLPQQRQALLRRPSTTSRGILLEVEPALLSAPLHDRLTEIDARLAAHIGDPARVLATRELDVVPILGVPGWHPANEESGFYDNTDYFRPARRSWEK